jgi:hypothetical protein
MWPHHLSLRWWLKIFDVHPSSSSPPFKPVCTLATISGADGVAERSKALDLGSSPLWAWVRIPPPSNFFFKERLKNQNPWVSSEVLTKFSQKNNKKSQKVIHNSKKT